MTELATLNPEQVADAVAAYNRLTAEAAALLPFDQPIARVMWVPVDRVQANDYNPNSVAKNEMRLLHTSIAQDGYTQPVVTIYDEAIDKWVIVDGFHRYTVMRTQPDIWATTHGYLPIVVIDKPLAERIAATVRHNRARGRHSVAGMGNLVFEMLDAGLSDEQVCNQIGLEPQELLRLKHVTGFSKLLEDHEYQRAWETKRQVDVKGIWLAAHPDDPHDLRTTVTDTTTNRWTYRNRGGENYPVHHGDVWAAGPHIVACADLTRDIPRVRTFWADTPKVLYTDPPWNNGMVTSFFGKAGRPKGATYHGVIDAILSLAADLHLPAWMEASLHQRTDTQQMIEAAGGRNITRHDITYFHRSPADLWQTTWGPTWTTPHGLAGADDEDLPRIVLAHHRTRSELQPGDIVLDTCVGLGLTAAAALATGCTLYATELSPYRMSATLTRLATAGHQPHKIGQL